MKFLPDDPDNRLMRETVLADHKDPKVQVIVETEILDFGFLGIEDIESLRSKEPRAGVRKEKEENEEDEEKQAEENPDKQQEEEAKNESDQA